MARRAMDELGVHNVEVGIRNAEANIEGLKRRIINGLDVRPQDIWVDALQKWLTDLAREQVRLRDMTDVREWMDEEIREVRA